MAKKQEQPKERQQLQVKVPNEMRGGVYANVANINVTQSEVVLNFIFANPHDEPKGTLVSRVIVSRRHALKIAKLLEETVNTANEVNPE